MESTMMDKYGFIDGITKALGRIPVSGEQSVTVMFAVFKDLHTLKAILEEEDKRGNHNQNQPGEDV